MSTLFLLVVAGLAFAMGYRFYAKLLAVWVFRSPALESPTAWEAPMAALPAVRFGYHVAAVAAAGTITGVVVAGYWGWIPAFLWLVVASVLAAGVYGLGGFWLTRRFGADSLPQLAATLLGPRARAVTHGLVLLVLVTLAAGLLWLCARLLAHYPDAVVPFWLQIPIALAAGWALNARLPLIPVSLLALGASLLTVGLADGPIAFSGALNVDVAGHSRFSVQAPGVWAGLLLIALWASGRRPFWAWVGPRGYLAGLLAGCMLVLLLSGIVLAHPPVSAPDFRAAAGPGALPWLAVTVTGGALAGFHLLIIHGISARQTGGPTEARRLGYGGALLDGLFALGALVIVSASFTGLAQWQDFYGTWQGLADLRGFDLASAIVLYVTGFAHFAQALGLSKGFAETLAVVALLGLFVTTLEACLRLLIQGFTQLRDDYPQAGPRRDQGRLWLALGLVAAAAAGWQGNLVWWPLSGLLSHALAALGLMLMALALYRDRRPVGLVVLPLAAVLVFTLWAALAALPHAWEQGDFWLFTGVLLFITLEAAMLVEAALRLKKPMPAAPET